MKNILVIFIALTLTSCLTTPAMRENIDLRAKVETLEREIKQLKGDTSVMIISPIVLITPDYKNMPSYCNPKKYSIAQFGDKYFIRLPYGTMDEQAYNTPQEVQREINMRASDSFKRWIQTGGSNF